MKSGYQVAMVASNGDSEGGGSKEMELKSYGTQEHMKLKSRTAKDDESPLINGSSAPTGGSENHGDSSLLSVICNAVNCICGSGEVGIPYAFRLGGFGLGTFLLALLGIMSGYNMHLVVIAGQAFGVTSFPELIGKAFGDRSRHFITILVMLFPLMGMISYKVIAGDTVSTLVRRAGGESINHSVLANRQFVVVMFTLLVTFPLSLYRDIGKLAKWSCFSLLLVVYIGIVLMVRAFTFGPNISNDSNPWTFAHFNFNFVKSINIMSFAYVCHHAVLQMYKSLHKPSIGRWNITVGVSISTSFIIMLLYGIVGYTTFTTLTQGDVLENLCYNDILADSARVALAVHVVLVYPIEVLVVREAYELILFPASQPPPLWRHIIMTSVFVAFSVAVSLTTNCLGIVQELAGAIGGTPLCYIIPGLAYIKMSDSPLLSKRNIAPLIIITIGLFASLMGLALVILEIIHGVTCHSSSDMPYCPHLGNKSSTHG